ALASLDDADPRHDPGARRLPVVDLPRGEGVQLEKRRPGVEEAVDPLAGEELAAGAVPLDGPLAAARGDRGRARAQLLDEASQPLLAAGEVAAALDAGLQHGHHPRA